MRCTVNLSLGMDTLIFLLRNNFKDFVVCMYCSFDNMVLYHRGLPQQGSPNYSPRSHFEGQQR